MTAGTLRRQAPDTARGELELRRRAAAEQRWSRLTFWGGVAIVLAFPVLSAVHAFLGTGDPNAPDFDTILLSPSWAHPFGTDNLGRDLFARVLAATPLDYLVGLVTTLVPMVLGVGLGLVAGYFGGMVDTLIMRLVDIVIAFPFLVFLLAAVAVFGPGLTGIYVGLITFGWASFARVTRAEMLVLRERQFISAARTLGLPGWRILAVHALPSALRPNLVLAMAAMVTNILSLAALSYLGLGVQPPQPEWGAIVADGQTYLISSWWIATMPGLVIVLVGVGFSLIGDGLADRLGHDFRITA